MITCVILLRFILTLSTIVLTASKKSVQRSSKSILNSAFNGYEILESNILTKSGVSLMQCSSLCTDIPSCLSLNYNKITKTCVLFDNDFTDISETSTSNCGDSWFYYYIVRDVEMKSAECGASFTTDICSQYCLHYLHNNPAWNYTQLESGCNGYDGGQMVIVDRQLKNHCVKELMVKYTHNVYVQGKLNATTNTWTYNDGTTITYFNWNNGQPGNGVGKIYIGLMLNEGYWNVAIDDLDIHATVCQQT